MAAAGAKSVGHPIDVATGVMTLDETDIEVPCLVPLTFTRHYSVALRAEHGVFGPGWRCEYDVELVRDLEGYTLVTATGDRVTFDVQHDDDATTLRNPGAFYELRRRGSAVTITHWDADTLALTHYAFVLSATETRVWATGISTEPGQWRLLTRDAMRRLVRVTESRGGRALELTYEADRIATITLVTAGAQSIVARFGYDDRGRVISAEDRWGVASTYEYDTLDRIVRERTRDGGVFSFRYDGAHRCVYTAGLDGYDAQHLTYFTDGRKTQVVDAAGQTWIYTWRADGQVEEVISPLGTIRRTGYDELGRITSQTDALGESVTYTYDEHGDRVRVETSDGRVHSYRFDEAHHMLEAVDPLGHAWRWELDDEGRVLAATDPTGARWEYRWGARGDLDAIIDPLRNAVTYDRDARGDLVRASRFDGASWYFERDVLGLVCAQTDPTGLTTRIARDAEGRVTSVTLPSGETWRYGWDAAGNLWEEIAPDGARTVLRYGPCRRLLQIEQADGSRVMFRWTNVPGQLAELVNEAGAVFRFEYDAMGRMVREEGFDGSVQRLTLDAEGRSVRVEREGGSVRELTYDAAGNVTLERLGDGEERSYAYDLSGRLIEATNRAATVHFTRDAVGRVVEERVGEHVVTSDFDALGRRVRMATSGGVDVRYHYDERGPLRGVEVRDREATWRSAFVHDAAGRMLRQVLPGAVEAQWSWGSGGLLDARRVRHAGDVVREQRYVWRRHDQLARVIETGGADVTYTHDVRGYLTRASFSDGRVQHRVADAVGNLFGHVERRDRVYAAGGALLHDGVSFLLTPFCSRLSKQRSVLGGRHGMPECARRTWARGRQDDTQASA